MPVTAEPTPARASAEALLTKAQAAERLNVTERFIERIVAERRIRHVRVGRFVRIPESAIAEFISQATVDTAPRIAPRTHRHRRVGRRAG